MTKKINLNHIFILSLSDRTTTAAEPMNVLYLSRVSKSNGTSFIVAGKRPEDALQVGKL